MRSDMGSDQYRMTAWQKLLFVGIVAVIFFIYRWFFSPSDAPSVKQRKEHALFIDSVHFKGRITNVAEGRELRFWVDNGPAIKWPGLIPVDSLVNFRLDNDFKIGDSIVKEAGSDRVRIRTMEGREFRLKTVL